MLLVLLVLLVRNRKASFLNVEGLTQFFTKTRPAMRPWRGDQGM